LQTISKTIFRDYARKMLRLMERRKVCYRGMLIMAWRKIREIFSLFYVRKGVSGKRNGKFPPKL
jgi:hypothetical protein